MIVRTRSFFPAVIWFIFITILFVLPGSDFPDEDWFHKVYLDKWVHSGFFFLLVYLFELPLITRKSIKGLHYFRWIMFMAIGYGISIEFIQREWIPGRSFDVLDMMFDAVGAVIAYIIGCKQFKSYLKK